MAQKGPRPAIRRRGDPTLSSGEGPVTMTSSSLSLDRRWRNVSTLPVTATAGAALGASADRHDPARGAFIGATAGPFTALLFDNPHHSARYHAAHVDLYDARGVQVLIAARPGHRSPFPAAADNSPSRCPWFAVDSTDPSWATPRPATGRRTGVETSASGPVDPATRRRSSGRASLRTAGCPCWGSASVKRRTSPASGTRRRFVSRCGR